MLRILMKMLRITRMTKIVPGPDGTTTSKCRPVMKTRDKKNLLNIFDFIVIPVACIFAGYLAYLCG